MRAAGQDYRIVDLQSVTPDALADHSQLVLHGGDFMHREVQQLLADHLAAGRRLELLGPIPRLDEHLRPCTVLADALRLHADAPEPTIGAPEPAAATVTVLGGHADAYWRASGPASGYLTVLVQSDNQGPITIDLTPSPGEPTRTVQVSAAAGGAAVLRIQDGELDDFLVTGTNEFLDSAVPPVVTVDGQGFHGDQPAEVARVLGVTTHQFA